MNETIIASIFDIIIKHLNFKHLYLFDNLCKLLYKNYQISSIFNVYNTHIVNVINIKFRKDPTYLCKLIQNLINYTNITLDSLYYRNKFVNLNCFEISEKLKLYNFEKNIIDIFNNRNNKVYHIDINNINYYNNILKKVLIYGNCYEIEFLLYLYSECCLENVNLINNTNSIAILINQDLSITTNIFMNKPSLDKIEYIYNNNKHVILLSILNKNSETSIIDLSINNNDVLIYIIIILIKNKYNVLIYTRYNHDKLKNIQSELLESNANIRKVYLQDIENQNKLVRMTKEAIDNDPMSLDCFNVLGLY
jgi:hypothetical protein